VISFRSSRRNLPRWQEPGAVYFITWRLKDEEILSPEERDIVLKSLLHWQGIRWEVYAAVVMPNHIHVIAQPLTTPDGASISLSSIIHSVKTFCSRQVNALRGCQGALWQDERHDRLIRDEKELLEKWGYLRHNPVERGLTGSPEDYPWLYEKN
jgi:putative transposase